VKPNWIKQEYTEFGIVRIAITRRNNMSIWDFSDYEYEDLKQILFHIDELEKLGVQLDDEMKAELQREIEEIESKMRGI